MRQLLCALNSVTVGHAGVLRSLYDKVTSTIDAQSVAREMFQSNALTLRELESIQSRHNESVKAAEQLLNIVMNQSSNVYSCFLQALKKAGDEHAFEVIVSDSCKGKYDALFGIRRVVHISQSAHFVT